MTEKLFYEDSHLFTFSARLLRYETEKNGQVSAVLDRTAFFPGGGGQLADTGQLEGVRIVNVHERNGEIFHVLEEAPIAGTGEGGEVLCFVDAEKRLRRMQNHSGEHVFSGLVHRGYSYENVGFHMGDECMTIDFSGELTWEQLLEIERLANETVRADLPVRIWFPSPEELEKMEYRSKLALTEGVRIVEIPGVDRCACCAPHVSRTGEIGLIKVLSGEKHRGGVRIELVCGMDALDNFNARQKSVTEISNLLSAKRTEITSAVEHLIEERDALKFRQVSLEREVIAALAEDLPETETNLLLIREDDLSEVSRRELVNLLMRKCGGMAAVFAGSDGTGYRYIIGSSNIDLHTKAREINAALSGRGGGRSEMIMGSCTAPASEIRRFFR